MRLFTSLATVSAVVALLSLRAGAQETTGVNNYPNEIIALDGVACASGDSRCSYGRTWFGTLYFDREAVGDLWGIASDVFHNNVRYYDRYFLGGALSYVVLHDLRIPIPFTEWTATHNRIEIEGQLDQHFGTTHNTEAVLAAVFRSGDVPLFAGIAMNVALGDGPSFSFSAPGEPLQRKFLNYISAEVEFGSDQLPSLHVVPQLHHRSGGYGLIAPSAAGSNYLGVGVRVDLN
jgi:hypothetical protein